MRVVLHIPGEATRPLRWTDQHPQSGHGAGVLLHRHSGDIFDSAALLAAQAQGGWIETDRPDRVRRALGLPPGEGDIRGIDDRS